MHLNWINFSRTNVPISDEHPTQTSLNAVEAIRGSARRENWPRVIVRWSESKRRFFESKYSLERYVGWAMLVGFAPLIGTLWLLVKGTSRGPGFYRQERVGLDGQSFGLIKLRSMKQDAERSGEAIWCQQGDHRITWLGRILRKLHLDELPQLWNVAMGEMSLIGPRPERPSICEKLSENIEGYYDRVLVKPGISGLSQINLPADQTLEDVKRKQILDLHYINETNKWFELRILLATGLRIIGLKGELIIRLMRLSRRSLVDFIEPAPMPVAEREAALAAVQPSVDELEVSLLSFFDEFFQVPDSELGRESTPPLPKRILYRSRQSQSVDNSAPQQNVTNGMVANSMTVDVEDYFQVSAFADRVTRNDWDRYECRVEVNTNRVLSLFDAANVKGTFFVLGWVAERYPALVRRIVEAGHEIGSHGYWHQLVYDLTPEQFAKDVVASKDAIYNACGIEVDSYRAPSFSIVPRSRWALEVLAELGFKYDSSVFPMSGHDRYGDPDAPKQIHRIQTQYGELIEAPPTTGNANGIPVPIGGGYFRLFPVKLTQLAIDSVRDRIGPAMFYLHPWELDPDQPRIFKNASRKSQFRHYVGLKRTEIKLRRILQSHEFDTMTNVVRAVLPTEVTPKTVPLPQLKIARRKKPTGLPVGAIPQISPVNTAIHQ